MLVALALKEELAKLEAAGRLRAEVQLLTCANPLGLAQAVLGNAQGRFELASGNNYNRGFPFLAGPIATAVEGQLGSDATTNLRLIRSAWHDALQALPETTALAALQKRLMLLAHDADVVLDLHCSKEATMHLYTSDGLWGVVEPLARYIGARATLLALDSGAQSFDEALSYTWVQLQQKFGERFPVPNGSVAVTVEHRGQRDVSYPLAGQDAGAILHYLTQQGDIDGTAPPLPELQAPATPLAGSEQFTAPVSGVLVHMVEVGARVQAGDVLFHIVDPISGARTEIASQTTGVVYMRKDARFVRLGDPLGRVSGSKIIRSGKLLGA